MNNNYFKDASDQFYKNSKIFDETNHGSSEKLNTYVGLFNLTEGLKKLQEDLNTIMLQLELIENEIQDITTK